MKQMKIALALCAALILMITIPTASAITVDGYNDTGEWDVNWAFGQNNNVSHAYNPNGPFGDRMEVRQGGVNRLITSEWNMVDPKNDSGGDFDESMASAGESSGSDISKVYAHYDMVNDTLYGMSEVYGIPGDYDGDGDVSQTNPDTVGSAGPAGSGLGSGESWTIGLYQDSQYSIITVSNNDWAVDSNTAMTYPDVDARLSNDAGNSVYEISISDFSDYFTIAPGAKFEVEIAAGATPDEAGEDFGTLVFQIPDPIIDIEKSTNGEDADNPTGALVPVGDDVEWEYVVTNEGNVPLENITVTDDKGVTAVYQSGDDGDNILQTDEVWIYNATGTSVAGQYENNATVTGEYEQITVVDEDPSHYFGSSPLIDIEKSTNGVDADTPTGPFVSVGDEVEWIYNVTNTGNVNLSSIVVQDNMGATPAYVSGDTNGDSILQTDEVWMYNATGVAEEGQYANIGNVTGTDPTGAEVTDKDPSHYFGVNSSIDIEKATNGVDADDPTGPYVTVGGDVVWTYNVTNTGNSNLTDIVVQDNVTGEIDNIIDAGNGDNILEPGEMWTYTAEGTAEEGQYANIGNVTGTDPTGAEVTDEDPSHYFGVNSSIDIEKATNGVDADDPTGPYVTVGGDVVWTYNVTNTGNANLTGIQVQDNMGATPAYVSGDTNGDSILQTDEVWMYNATGVAEEGQYANIGNVTGTDPTGADVTDEDPSHYFGVNSSIDIEKATNGVDADDPTGPYVTVGGDVVWTYNVTNTGNANLTGIQVQDNMGATPAYVSGDTNGDSILQTDEVWMYNATGVAEEGQYANIGNVTGTDPTGADVTDEDPSHYFGVNSSIDIEKATNGVDADDPTGPYVTVGGDVVWTYNVTNTGNSNLTGIQVQDNMGATPAYVSGDTNSDSILQTDEVWMYNATGAAEEGQYANIGNVTGTDPTDAEVTDEDPSHYFGVNSSIDIEKATNGVDADDPTGPTIDEGNTVNWEYVVTNTGNVNLTNIIVTDDQGEIPEFQSSNINGDNILEPGEIWTYTASGTAGTGQYANIGNVTGEHNGDTVTDEDPSHYFGEEPPRSTLGNYVWEDLDRDGIQDETDTGIAGVTVNLYTGGEVLVDSTTTNETGYYLFTGLVAGDYFVEFVLPDGYEFSPVDQGTDDTVDSDASVTIGRTATTSLFAGEVDLTWDAGMYLPISIDIEKSTNGQDADDPQGPKVDVGSTVEWEYVVTNTGSANLTNINVTDDQGVNPVFQGSDLNNDSILEPGETWTYTANGTAEFGQYVNNATATGEYEGETVENSDPSHYYGEEKDVPTAHPLLTVALIGVGIVLFLRRKDE